MNSGASGAIAASWLSVRSGGSGGFGRKIRLGRGLWGPFSARFRVDRGVRDPASLRGVLRFEVNFGLFPLFLGIYKLLVGLVEGAFGGCLVADEEAEVLGDGVSWRNSPL